MLNSSLLYECTTICLFIQFEGHLGYFQPLPITNEVFMETQVKVLCEDKFPFLLDNYLGVGLPGYMVRVCLTL